MQKQQKTTPLGRPTNLGSGSWTRISDWVFPNNGGSKSWHIEDFNRPWYALLKRADVYGLRLHDLRRTFAGY